MDISADKYKSNGKGPGSFLAVLQTLLGIVRWSLRFFMLTEAERSQAGIDFGGKGRDE